MRKQERDHAKLKKKFELLQREKDLVYREKERLQKNNEALMAERNHLLEEHLLGKEQEFVSCFSSMNKPTKSNRKTCFCSHTLYSLTPS